jgi:trimeric autotransporter adhesin
LCDFNHIERSFCKSADVDGPEYTRTRSQSSWERIAFAFAAPIALIGYAHPAHAQLRSLANPGFESNDPQGPGAPNYEIITNGSVAGWDSTTGEIELWDSNFNGIPAHSGNVFAEMNANVPGTLYQNICLVNGEPLSWTFAHRARAGGSDPQVAIFEVANSGGTLIQSLATQSSTIAANAWAVNSGSTTYTGATGNQRVQFRTTNPGSLGNFLDSIQLTLRPFIQLSAASSSGVESIASANIGTLRVSGTATSAISVTVTVTGGTATLGTDYTTPGGGSSFTVTVPAGTYYDTAIPLGINITNDNLVESSETIALSFSAGTGYTVGNTTTCGAAAQTTSTYTITDDDSRVTLRKQWANAAVGDDANVTLLRGVTVIDTLASDAGTAGELDTDATPTAAVIGETLTLSEALVGGNIGSYSGAVACTGAADSNFADGLTIAAGETNIICTYTNTRLGQLLNLAKVWGANSKVGHTASATTTGGINNPTFTATAPTNITGGTVTVYSGEVITLPAETYGGGGLANQYTAVVACTGGTPLASGAVGRTITISNSATATTCTYTNTRKTATLTLRKTWVNAILNNAVSVSTSGLTTNTSLSSVANTANETDAATALTVYAGDTGAIAESFTTGLSSDYAAALACTGNTTALAGTSLTINGSDTAIVCTYTNSRTTQITVAKTSSITADGVSGANFKSLPGATVRYCILATNSGTATATNVSAVDILPANTSFVAGSIRSGTSCAGAASVEDDNNSGADESDPYGANVSGTTVTGVAPTLAAGASIAIVFNVLIL